MREEDSRLPEVDALCERSLYLQAWEKAQAIGPFEQWSSVQGMVVASRLASHLGAVIRAQSLILRAFRLAPRDPQVRARAAMLWFDKRGPWELWRFLQDFTPLPEAPSQSLGELGVARAQIALALRDFARADALLLEAKQYNPQEAMVPPLQAARLLADDRAEEAWTLIQEDLKLNPNRRQSLLEAAEVLCSLGRLEQAIELLSQGCAALESGALHRMLAALLYGNRQYEKSRQHCERYLALSPLLEPQLRDQAVGALSDCAWQLGDYAAARRFASESKNPFFLRLAERLARKQSPGRKVRLDVQAVRQHHLMCVPATLTALFRFWHKEEAAPEEVEKAIAYVGTPPHRERQYVESKGWRTREFRVTWESARALLDRSVPFVLHLASTTSGHAQAVMGYDEARETLLLRDPSLTVESEGDAQALCEQQAPWGPRGLALVPAEQSERLDGLELPEADLYDQKYAAELALESHDRETAARVVAGLERTHPEGRLTAAARRTLAAYDRDYPALQAAAEAQLKMYPKDGRAQLDVCSVMDRFASRDKRIERLLSWADQEDASAAILGRLAAELAADGRTTGRSVRLLRRAQRASPGDASVLAQWGSVLWAQRRFEAALDAFRFAACLDDRDEALARNWFLAAHVRRRTQEALALLTARAERLGPRSADPSCTLFWALDLVDRTQEAVEVLEKALAQRPEDGALLLFLAQERAIRGRVQEARELLEQARNRVRASEWQRTSCAIAAADRSGEELLEQWRKVLELEPLADDAHRQVLALLAALRGRAAADEHLATAVESYPHDRLLRQTQAEWLRGGDPEDRRRCLESLLEQDPADTWAHRERALVHLKAGKLEEARACWNEVHQLEPEAAPTWALLGLLCLRENDIASAERALLGALQRNPDAGAEILEAIGATPSALDRQALLDAVLAAWCAGGVQPDTPLVWYEVARGYVKSSVLTARLESLRTERPECWALWSIAVRQHLLLDDLPRAEEIALEMLERFPLVAPVHGTVADVALARGDVGLARTALEYAVRLSAGDTSAALRLSTLLHKQGEAARARVVLERALASSPLHSALRLQLALLERQEGNLEVARGHAERTLDLDPGNATAADLLVSLANNDAELQAVIARLQELKNSRPWSAELRVAVASVLETQGALEQALQEIEATLRDHPRCVAAHDARANLLARLQRLEEAHAACAPACFGQALPPQLRARAAWVSAQANKLEQARKESKELVADVPEYALGWAQLLEIERARGDPSGALRAAKRLAQLQPFSCSALCSYSDSLFATGKKTRALKALAKAVAMSPPVPDALERMFHVARYAGDTALAQTALDSLRPLDPERGELGATLLALQRGDWEQARAHCEALLLLPTLTEGRLDRVRIGFLRAGFGDEFHALLGTLRSRPEVIPRAKAWWGAVEASRQGRAIVKQLPQFDPSSPEAQGALSELLSSSSGQSRSSLLGLCWQLRSWIRSEVALSEIATLHLVESAGTWGGFWCVLGLPRRQLSHKGQLAIAVALRRVFLTGAALAVCERAIAQTPDEPWRSSHTVWVAYEAALVRRTAVARQLLDSVRADVLSGEHAQCYVVTQAILAVQQADPKDRARLSREARTKLPPVSAGQLLSAHAWEVHRALVRLALDSRELEAYLHAYLGLILVVPMLIVLALQDPLAARVSLFLGATLVAVRIVLAWLARSGRSRWNA